MASKLMSTGLVPDSDLEDTDIYGNVPLFAFADEDEGGDEDSSNGAADIGARGGDEDEEAPPLIEPSTRNVWVPKGDERNDDPSAFDALTSYGGGGASPGEAQRLIDYMRPLTAEEEELNEDPMFSDLTFADDAASVDNLLKHSKGSGKAMTKFMQDQIYGDDLSDEEKAERQGTESFVPAGFSVITNQSLVDPMKAQYEIVEWVDEPPVEDVTNQALVDVRKAKFSVISGLSKSLVKEHASWLEEQDRKAGIKLRPHDFYVNVSKLWAKDKLKKAALPTSLNGDFSGSLGAFVGAALAVNHYTKDKRLVDDSMGWGWNPIKALKSVAKKGYSLTKRSITDPLKYGYKLTKKGVQLTKKGIEKSLSLAQRAALAPIKLIIGRFGNKIIGRRASFYAKQAGKTAPSPDMVKKANDWSKNYVRKHLPGIGRIVASLMGGDGPGSYTVDLSFGEIDRQVASAMGADTFEALGNDVMGLGLGDIGHLIGMGVTGITGALNNLMRGLFGMGSGGQPAPIDQPDDGSMPADESYQDPGAQDPGYGDPGASADPGYSDPGYADPGYADPGDDSQGWGRTITLEEMNHLSAKARTKVQNALRQGRIRLV